MNLFVHADIYGKGGKGESFFEIQFLRSGELSSLSIFISLLIPCSHVFRMFLLNKIIAPCVRYLCENTWFFPFLVYAKVDPVSVVTLWLLRKCNKATPQRNEGRTEGGGHLTLKSPASNTETCNIQLCTCSYML